MDPTEALLRALKEELSPLRSELGAVSKVVTRLDERLNHQIEERGHHHRRHNELESRVRDIEHRIPPELAERVSKLETSEASRRTRDALVVSGLTLVITVTANFLIAWIKSGAV